MLHLSHAWLQQCCAIAEAMDIASWRGEELATLKATLGSAVGLPQARAVRGCVSCTPTTTCQRPWVTMAGQREYEMSCVCEACYDELFKPTTPAPQLPGLTQMGVVLVQMWVQIRKACRELRMPATVGRQLQRWANGQEPWPQVRQSLVATTS